MDNSKKLVLSEIKVENLGVIRLIETPLKPGVNLVAGPNGSGKSTLISAASTLINGANVTIDVKRKE